MNYNHRLWAVNFIESMLETPETKIELIELLLKPKRLQVSFIAQEIFYVRKGTMGITQCLELARRNVEEIHKYIYQREPQKIVWQ